MWLFQEEEELNFKIDSYLLRIGCLNNISVWLAYMYDQETLSSC